MLVLNVVWRKIKMNIIKMVVVAAVLLWNSIYDLNYKKISIPVTFLGMIMGVFFIIITLIKNNGYYIIIEALGGVSVGIFLILCSFFTRGQIGIGDGIICCFTGLFYGFFENLSMLFIGLLLSALVSFLLLLSKKAGRKTEIPFVPFLFLGYCCIQICKI